MARISFTVQGLSEGDRIAAAARDEVLRALLELGLDEPGFEAGRQIFSVEIDPARHSFSDIRRAIAAAGQRTGRTYLAVVMSP